ncbi:MAG: hypothetical protein CVU06_14585, partial [Bacteroidetes bacterium HGW-Bacteroidetes-22]
MKKIYCLLLTFLTLLIHAGTLKSQVIVSGAVSGTWDNLIHVTGDIWINEGESLVINPGTRVVFIEPAIFNVWGSVNSNGTSEQPVIFTVADSTGFADSSQLTGAWQGIVFSHMVANTDSSIFTNTVFEYTKDKRDAGETSWGGAITAVGFSKLRFSFCNFISTHSWSGGGAAAMTAGANIIFQHCSFENCRVYDSLTGFGGALYAREASPIVEHCTFYNNKGGWLGGGLCFYYSDPLIRFNEFKGNSALIGGGISLVHCRPARIISNNVIHQNGPAYFGGGVACNNACDPVFANNTIVDNYAAYGGGFYCNDSAAPTVINSIITNNYTFGGDGPQVYIWDIYSHPNFFYSNIEGGLNNFAGSGALGGYHGVFADNLDTANYFDIKGPLPWALSDSSPLRDAGNPDTAALQIPPVDFANQLRLVKGRIDIGAFEWQSGEGVSQISTVSVSVAPNPSNGTVVIRLPKANDGLFQV